jgi:hypothetical protein
MPKVGNKHFPYTRQGYEDAAVARRNMKGGGKVIKYSKGRKVKIRGTGAATKGLFSRGPMG